MSSPAESTGGAPPPPSQSGRGRLIAAVLAVLLVVVGGAAVFAAVNNDDGTSTAEGTPMPTRTRTRPTPTTVPTQSGSIAAEPSAPAGASGAGGQALDVTYCNNDGVDLQLDFYHARVDGPTPLLFFVHGGGWTSGDKNQLARMSAFEPLLEAGYSLASANYRLSPQYQFPAQINDVKCAVRHLRANAATYGIDPDRIAVSGFSAGGHLAMLVATADETAGFDVGQYPDVSSAVSAVVEFDGQVDIAELAVSHPETLVRTFGQSNDLMVQASPVTYLDADDPPFLIFHGDADQVVSVDQAYLLEDRLKELGIDYSLVIIPGGEHQLPADPAYATTVIDFLDRYLA